MRAAWAVVVLCLGCGPRVDAEPAATSVAGSSPGSTGGASTTTGSGGGTNDGGGSADSGPVITGDVPQPDPTTGPSLDVGSVDPGGAFRAFWVPEELGRFVLFSNHGALICEEVTNVPGCQPFVQYTLSVLILPDDPPGEYEIIERLGYAGALLAADASGTCTQQEVFDVVGTYTLTEYGETSVTGSLNVVMFTEDGEVPVVTEFTAPRCP